MDKGRKMPKVKHVGGTSADKSILGKSGTPTQAPFKAGPDKGVDKSSAPYHWKSQATKSTPFPKKK